MASGSADVDAGEFEANLTLQNIYGYVLIISAGITRSLGMVLVQKMKGHCKIFSCHMIVQSIFFRERVCGK